MKKLDLVFEGKFAKVAGAKVHLKMVNLDPDLTPDRVKAAMAEVASFDFLVDTNGVPIYGKPLGGNVIETTTEELVA
ncbi:DUF2922 family protein [Weissella sp. GP1]|uniref:DUF2922 family protein n=1 Tax=Weissella confusa TaxID=1583 RepID=UPI0032DAEE52